MNRLFYEQPARCWEEALPLGNGRLGAMVFGDIRKERIQVNEESVWYEGPMNRINPDAKEAMPKIRKLIAEGRIAEAQKLLKVAFTGCPCGMNPYQTLGDFYLEFDYPEVNPVVTLSPDLVHVELDTKEMGYQRSLNLNTAVTDVTYRLGNTEYSRECFISKPADLFVMKLRAKGENKISFQARLDRSMYMTAIEKVKKEGIRLFGKLGEGGSRFSMELRAKAEDGTVEVIGETLMVTGATTAYLYFAGDTDYHYTPEEIGDAGKCFLDERLEERFQKAMARDYQELLQEHIEDHQALFDRVKFDLGMREKDGIPTDVRLEKVAQGEADHGLMELLFQYGRYLMIAGSRPGTLPTTLQGLWAQEFIPPWGGKYTININTEMNYWPAESCNLSECHLPLFRLLEIMLPRGRKVAREMYGARGFVAHHNTNIHGDCAPQDLWYPATYWPMGAAWLCTHVWTHYQYTGDVEFLKKYYPIVLEAALYFVDALTEWGDYLVTNPSSSPENVYILPNGERGAVCFGPTMDNQILRDLFDICQKGAKVLGDEVKDIVILEVSDVTELLKEIAEKRERLVPTRIGSDGRIMEWLEEYEEEEPGHRHISQLYGLFPSEQITVDGTPEYAEAAKKTLEERLRHGGGHTGWSRAWIMNHYAKLWDGEKAYDNITKMLIHSTYPNMFDKHPPFQIDGNFGASAAIAQMLVQSNDKRVILLPALPDAWEKGSVSGLCLVGGAKVDLSWENHCLKNCRMYGADDYSTTVVYKEKRMEISLKEGQSWDFE